MLYHYSLPIKIWFANVVIPTPPLVIDNVPNDTLDAFKFVIEAPEPEKLSADTFVADIVLRQVVPVKMPVNIPPVKGKTNDNVEDIGVPFLHI